MQWKTGLRLGYRLFSHEVCKHRVIATTSSLSRDKTRPKRSSDVRARDTRGQLGRRDGRYAILGDVEESRDVDVRGISGRLCEEKRTQSWRDERGPSRRDATSPSETRQSVRCLGRRAKRRKRLRGWRIFPTARRETRVEMILIYP